MNADDFAAVVAGLEVTHWMDAEHQETGGVLFTCPNLDCGKQILVKADGPVVIRKGDPRAEHVGGTHGVFGSGVNVRGA